MKKFFYYLTFAVILCAVEDNFAGATSSASNPFRGISSGLRDEGYEVNKAPKGDFFRRGSRPLPHETNVSKRDRERESGAPDERRSRSKDSDESFGGKSHQVVADAPKRGQFVSEDPKYMISDTRSYQQAIKSLQNILKGVGNTKDGNGFEYGNSGKTGSNDVITGGNGAGVAADDDDGRFAALRWRRRRKKRVGAASRSGKGYLDYTNSQMPFNEGTRWSVKEQQRKAIEESKSDSRRFADLARESAFFANELKKREDDAPGDESKCSRVRRYLGKERIRKQIKGSTTLEAKEAAMSRVLDPNLNLDGILEPHVRKRRYGSKGNDDDLSTM